MSLKGLVALNRGISKIVNAEFGISNAECSKSYSYSYIDDTIYFKLDVDIEDEWFSEFIYKTFGYQVNNPFIMALLHEIGHAETEEDVTEDEFSYCFDEKKRIGECMDNTEDPTQLKAYEWEYFRLPDEIRATTWAVEYARENPNTIKALWEQIHPILMEFYKVNGITEEEA